MPTTDGNSLRKNERVYGLTLVEALFKGGGSRSMPCFPIRLVYCFTERDTAPARMLVSVPKRCLHHAVERNRVKRQVREAYRLNKHLLDGLMEQKPDKTLLLAFIWMDDKTHSSSEVAKCVEKLLKRVGEKI